MLFAIYVWPRYTYLVLLIFLFFRIKIIRSHIQNKESYKFALIKLKFIKWLKQKWKCNFTPIIPCILVYWQFFLFVIHWLVIYEISMFLYFWIFSHFGELHTFVYFSYFILCVIIFYLCSFLAWFVGLFILKHVFLHVLF